MNTWRTSTIDVGRFVGLAGPSIPRLTAAIACAMSLILTACPRIPVPKADADVEAGTDADAGGCTPYCVDQQAYGCNADGVIVVAQLCGAGTMCSVGTCIAIEADADVADALLDVPVTDDGADHGTSELIEDPGPSDPGTSDPGNDPGTSDPGTSDPGTSDPGNDPGTSDPGTSDPGTSDPGTSDPGTSDPGGDSLPTTTTIAELQQDQAQTACAPTAVVAGSSVSLVDVLVASGVYDIDPTQQGFYAQDPAAPDDWAGVLVVAPLGVLDGLTAGDVVNVLGDIEEFYCMTQINAASVTASGTGTPAAAIALTVPEEAYEGMLVTVSSVTVIAKLASGTYDIGGGLQVANDFNAPLVLYLGEPYTITGFLKYADNAWQIAPRNVADTNYEGTLSPQTIADLQQSASSLSCTTPANTLVTEGIVVEGTVSVGRFDVTDLLHGYHLTSGGAAFESIAISVPKVMNTNYVEGQVVRVIGDHVEFFCNTQVAATSLDVLATEATPAPVSPALAVFADDVESWEGSVVTLSGLVVSDSPDFVEFGEIRTTTVVQGTALIIDDAIVGPGVLTLPPSGTTVTVTGAVRFSFGAYKITPRSISEVSW